MREEASALLAVELEAWMRECRAQLSFHAEVAKAMDDMLERWGAFTRFLFDRRICLTNNAAERALRAACMYSLIVTAKLKDVDPQAWLADILARIAEHPAKRLDALLPWNWKGAAAGNAA